MAMFHSSLQVGPHLIGKKSFGKVPRKDLVVSPSHSSEEEEESRCSAPSSRDSSPGREEEDTAVYVNLEAAAVIEEVRPMEDDVDPQDTQRTSEEDENTEDERRMDQEDELGDLRPVGSKRKRRVPPVMLPDAVERELGDWLEHEVPYFYDKSLPDYKNKAKQRAVLEEKGKTFEPPVPVEQLLQWLKTIRTRYVFLYYLII